VPESRTRRKPEYTPPPAKKQAVKLDGAGWVAPVMVGLFLLGLAWIITYYLSSGGYPIPSIGAWNMLVGFGAIAAGFVVSTRWK
jgi:hypothetical protein